MDYEEIKQKVKEKVLEKLDFSLELQESEIESLVDEEMIQMTKEYYIPLSRKISLSKEIFFSIRKLDILQDLILDESVTEIMVNGPDCIFIERKGMLIRYEESFENV